MIHVNITILGNVHKVGYRFLSMQYCTKAGINGFVQYMENNMIYIEAEGTSKKIEAFINWCRTGECSYGISQISIERDELKGFTSFEIVDD